MPFAGKTASALDESRPHVSPNWFGHFIDVAMPGRDDLANSELRVSESIILGNAKMYDPVGIGWFGPVISGSWLVRPPALLPNLIPRMCEHEQYSEFVHCLLECNPLRQPGTTKFFVVNLMENNIVTPRLPTIPFHGGVCHGFV